MEELKIPPEIVAHIIGNLVDQGNLRDASVAIASLGSRNVYMPVAISEPVMKYERYSRIVSMIKYFLNQNTCHKISLASFNRPALNIFFVHTLLGHAPLDIIKYDYIEMMEYIADNKEITKSYKSQLLYSLLFELIRVKCLTPQVVYKLYTENNDLITRLRNIHYRYAINLDEFLARYSINQNANLPPMLFDYVDWERYSTSGNRVQLAQIANTTIMESTIQHNPDLYKYIINLMARRNIFNVQLSNQDRQFANAILTVHERDIKLKYGSVQRAMRDHIIHIIDDLELLLRGSEPIHTALHKINMQDPEAVSYITESLSDPNFDGLGVEFAAALTASTRLRNRFGSIIGMRHVDDLIATKIADAYSAFPLEVYLWWYNTIENEDIKRALLHKININRFANLSSEMTQLLVATYKQQLRLHPRNSFCTSQNLDNLIIEIQAIDVDMLATFVWNNMWLFSYRSPLSLASQVSLLNTLRQSGAIETGDVLSVVINNPNFGFSEELFVFYPYDAPTSIVHMMERFMTFSCSPK